MAAFKTIQHARNPESWSSGKSSSRGTWREGRRRRKHWLRNNSLACLTENAGCQFPWTLLPPSSNILMTPQCGQSPEGYLYSLWAAGPGCLLGLQSPSVLTAAGTWCKPHADLHRPDAGLKETTTVHAENMYCIQNPLDYSVMQSLQLLRVWMCVFVHLSQCMWTGRSEGTVQKLALFHYMDPATWNTDHQAWLQELSPTKPSCQWPTYTDFTLS